MKTLFVATVGKGTGPEVDIVPPLVNSIRRANPDYLLLFVTGGSRANGEKIIKELGRTPENSWISQLQADGGDIEALFKEMLDVLTQTMKQQKIAPENVTADFTTGLKTMSAALTLAAVQLGFNNLQYIYVKRDAESRVKPGTERFISLTPNQIRDSMLLQTAFNLMKNYRFATAIQILKNLHLLNETEEALKEQLITIADAYIGWDLFNHKRFVERYRNANLQSDYRLEIFQVKEETINLVDGIVKAKKEKEITDLMIVDLLNNAERRFNEGRYDDAVARLYRTCEMLAQWRLQRKYGVNTSDVSLDKVPEESRNWLSGYRNQECNKIQIGLKRSYQLLTELKDELGAEYNDLKGLLKRRNYSILAHGIEPIDKDVAESMLKKLGQLLSKHIEEFETKRELLKFPF